MKTTTIVASFGVLSLLQLGNGFQTAFQSVGSRNVGIGASAGVDSNEAGFDASVKSYFPDAIKNAILKEKVLKILVEKWYSSENTLLATSLCCDELARRLEDVCVEALDSMVPKLVALEPPDEPASDEKTAREFLEDPVILFTPDEASSKGRDRQEYIDEAFIVNFKEDRENASSEGEAAGAVEAEAAKVDKETAKLEAGRNLGEETAKAKAEKKTGIVAEESEGDKVHAEETEVAVEEEATRENAEEDARKTEQGIEKLKGVADDLIQSEVKLTKREWPVAGPSPPEVDMIVGGVFPKTSTYGSDWNWWENPRSSISQSDATGGADDWWGDSTPPGTIWFDR